MRTIIEIWDIPRISAEKRNSRCDVEKKIKAYYTRRGGIKKSYKSGSKINEVFRDRMDKNYILHVN